MTGALDKVHRHRLNSFDLLVPDGQPVRWALRWLHGARLPDRVYGPSLMLQLCRRAAEEGLPIFLFGGNEELLKTLRARLGRMVPGLRIAGCQASRFRALTADEQQELVENIRATGAKLVFVGHALMENRHGLLVDFQVSEATGTAERDVVPELLAQARERGFRPRTLGADKGYDTRECVAQIRAQGVTPHVARNTAHRRSAIDGRTTRHAGYAVSQRIRNPLSRGVIVTLNQGVDPLLAPLALELEARACEGRADIIRRAVERRELPPGTDCALVGELFFAPLFKKLLTSGEKLSRRDIDTVIDIVIAGTKTVALAETPKRRIKASENT